MNRHDYLIKKLVLIPHPEGGFYKRNYTSGIFIDAEQLPNHNEGKYLKSVIYYLLKGEQKSKFHRLKSDEIWYFHEGCRVIIHCIYPSGEYKRLLLGNNLDLDEEFQILIAADTWFAAELHDKNNYALMSCSVSPAFDFDDFEIADTKKLLDAFPEFSDVIEGF